MSIPAGNGRNTQYRSAKPLPGWLIDFGLATGLLLAVVGLFATVAGLLELFGVI